MQKIIILRGATASGKSTLAKRYRNFKNKTIWLKIDNFKDYFDVLDDDVRVHIYGAANTSLDYFLKKGFSVVMEGIFQNPNNVQQAVNIAKKQHIPYRVFQLKVSLKTLQERDSIREGVPEGCRQPLGNDEIAKIYTVLEENYYPEAITLDTENMSIDECIAFIDKQFN